MNVPGRLVHGMQFKSGVVNKINEIIQYLKTQRLTGDNKSIKLNECCNGITISTIEGGGRSGQTGGRIHPFKVSITSDENGLQQVSVHGGNANLQGEDQVKQIFTFYEEPPEYYPGSDYQTYIPVDWNEVEDGESYCVVLCIYDEYDSENEVIQTKGACFVADLADYYAPCVPGFYTVPLAGIAKTTIEDEEGEETGYALAVTEQYIIGDITITDFYRLFPFAMNFLISFTEGAVADDETFNVYAVYLKDGKIYDDGGAYLIRDNADFAPNDDGTFYAYFEDGSIKWTDDISELAFSSNCFILAAFELQGAQIRYAQFINNDLVFKTSNLNYPFKLSINEDQETGEHSLQINPGQVYFLSKQPQLLNYTNSLIGVDIQTLEEGVYGVFGVVKYRNNETFPEIIITTGDITTHDLPNVSGYRTFAIGAFEVTVQTVEEEGETREVKSFYITLQLQHSNFTLEDKYFDLPFCAVCSYDDGQTSAVKSSVADFALTQVSVNQGAVIDANAADDNSYPAFSSLLTDSGFNMSGQTNAFCYVECINSASVWTKQIRWGTSSPEPYTADSGGNIVSMNIPLANVGKLNNQVQIQNFHPANVIFPVFDTYKVKVAGENDSLFQKKDEVPEFLSEKIKADRAENISNTSAWPGNGGGPLPGYIFKQAVDGEQGDPSYMFLRWDYPQISGWNGADYLQLNSREGALKWEQMGRVRVDSADNTPDFLSEKVEGVDIVSAYAENHLLKISANVSDFVREITTSGQCISAVITSATSSGKTVNIALDKPCLFDDFSIQGDSPVQVTGSGNAWNVAFDDRNFIKNVSGANCVSAVKSGNSVTVSLDKQCVFQDFSIQGTSPVQVTGSGNSWQVGLNESDFIKNVTGANCISAVKSGNSVTVSLNKPCVFNDFSIQGTSPVQVTGSGNNWQVGLNTSGLVKSVTGTNCISASNNAGAVTVSLDKPCVFRDFNIEGGNKISVTGSGNSWQVSYTGSGSGDGKEVTVTGTAPIIVTSSVTSSSASFNVAVNASGLITGVSGSNCISASVESGIANISLDKNCVFSEFTIDGTNGVHVTNDGEQDNQTWTIQLNVSGTGLLYFNNGTLSVVPLPARPSVLIGGPGGLDWISYSDCTSACN